MEITPSKGSTTALHECVVLETCMNSYLGNCQNSLSRSAIPAFRLCLLSSCLGNGFSSFSRKCVLASRCLAMDYSSFQASCHGMNFE
jgi:hypothetical protein